MRDSVLSWAWKNDWGKITVFETYYYESLSFSRNSRKPGVSCYREPGKEDQASSPPS